MGILCCLEIATQGQSQGLHGAETIVMEGNANWVRREGKRGEPYKLAPPQLVETAGEGGKLPASHGCHWVRHDYQWLCFWQRWAFRHLLGHQFSDLWGSLDEGEKVR